MNATMSNSQMAVLRAVRALPDEMAKPLRAAVFTGAKLFYDIPADHRVKAEIDDASHPRFGEIVRKKTDTTYPVYCEAGQWTVNPPVAVVEPVDTRWFYVPSAADALVDAVAPDVEWGDNSEPDLENSTQFTSDGRDVLVDNEGQVFVRLARSDL